MPYDKKSFILGLSVGLATRGVIERPSSSEPSVESGFGYAEWSFDESTRTLALKQAYEMTSYPFEYNIEAEALTGYVDDTDNTT